MDGQLSGVLELAGKVLGPVGALLGAYAVFAKRERKDGVDDYKLNQHGERLDKLETDQTKANATILLHTDLHRRYESATAITDRKLDALILGQGEIRGIVRGKD